MPVQEMTSPAHVRWLPLHQEFEFRPPRLAKLEELRRRLPCASVHESRFDVSRHPLTPDGLQASQ